MDIDNGQVSWSTTHLTSLDSIEPSIEFSGSQGVRASLDVGFPAIDWELLRSIYGWAAIQWQAWARGTLTCNTTGNTVICFHVEDVLEFWMDDKQYFGADYYAYRRQPLILRLDAGIHIVNIRLVRDVRLFGGTGQPNLSIHFTAAIVEDALLIHAKSCLFPEVVNGIPAGRYASVPLTNATSDIVDVHSIGYEYNETSSAHVVISTFTGSISCY